MNTDENQKLWINKIHENLILRWCSENTFINYKCALNNFFTYYDSSTDITILSEQDIIPYLNDCFIKPNKNKYTYNVSVASIKLLYIVCFNKHFDKLLLPTSKVIKKLPTVPYEPNEIFMYNQKICYNILFKATSETILELANDPKWLGVKVGITSILHTWSGTMNFHPHIHVIIAEIVFTKSKLFKPFHYFDYDALSKCFMKILLDKMEVYFGKKNFRDIKNKMYLKYPNVFYVNNKLEDDGYKFKSIQDLICYVTRYCSRPVIAETRILNYDGNNVTWYYSDHTHEQYHEITESAFSFITKLLRHPLPSNYKSIRSFGFYNKSDKIDNDTNMIIKKEKIPFMRSLLKWKDSILTSFHRIPIKCPKCGHLMDLDLCRIFLIVKSYF